MKRREQYKVAEVTEANIKEFTKPNLCNPKVGQWVVYLESELNDPNAYVYKKDTQESAIEKASDLNALRWSDFSQEEIEEFYQEMVKSKSILEAYLSNLLNLKLNLEFSHKVSNKGTHSFDFESEDFHIVNPIIAAAWRRMVVGNFGSNLSADNDRDCLRIYFSVNLFYEHHDGGENGAKIAAVEYHAKRGWTFSSEWERSFRHQGGYLND